MIIHAEKTIRQPYGEMCRKYLKEEAQIGNNETIKKKHCFGYQAGI